MWVITILALFISIEVVSVVGGIESLENFELVDFSEANGETEQKEENSKEDPLEISPTVEQTVLSTFAVKTYDSVTTIEVFRIIPTPPPNLS